MLSPLRNRFGIPGVISVIALVFAMFGGAYAASGGNPLAGASGKQQKKAKQGPRGPRGKTGPAGAAGPAGAQGPAGPAGAKGDKGDAGSNGTGGGGAPGKSVIVSESAPGCPEGGLTVEVEGSGAPHEVCNGAEGDPGPPGAIHPGETLPVNATETGSWLVELNHESGEGGGFSGKTAISFPIPLANLLDGAHVVVLEPSGSSAHCNDGVGAAPSAENPEAASGYLCVFLTSPVAEFLIEFGIVSVFLSGNTSESAGVSRSGGIFNFGTFEGSLGAYVHGTWAVTG